MDKTNTFPQQGNLRSSSSSNGSEKGKDGHGAQASKCRPNSRLREANLQKTDKNFASGPKKSYNGGDKRLPRARGLGQGRGNASGSCDVDQLEWDGDVNARQTERIYSPLTVNAEHPRNTT